MYKNNQKGFVPPGLFIVFIFLLVVILAFANSQAFKTLPVEQDTTAEENISPMKITSDPNSAGWTRYEDRISKISFSVPSDWILVPATQKNDLISLAKKENDSILNFSIKEGRSGDFENNFGLLNGTYQIEGSKMWKKVRNLEIDGLDAVKMYFEDTNFRYEFTATKSSGKYLEFVFSSKDKKYMGGNADIIDQVIGSVRFAGDN